MFHGRKGSHDVKKAASKFIDPRKDTHSRLRALQVLLEQDDIHQVKNLFRVHCVEIYFIFSEELSSLEIALKSKGQKSQREDLEKLLSILERIILYVPEKVHERWQFNSIGFILRKLLHHGNVLAIQEIGIRLFMLWLQALQENVDELTLLVYGSIVPGFPSPLLSVDWSKINRPRRMIEGVVASITGSGFIPASSTQHLSALDGESEWCIPDAATPLVPLQPGEKNPPAEELTKKFLDRILDYMTKRMMDMEWSFKHMRESGFYYMFMHFKRFYLPHIFPHWNPQDRLYTSAHELLDVPLVDPKSKWLDSSQAMYSCQRAVLSWVIAFTVRLKPKRRHSEDQSSESCSVVSQDSINAEATSSPTASPVVEAPPVLRQFEILCEAANVVRAVFYSTKENIHFVHEVLKQGFLLSLESSDLMMHILLVYMEWLKPQERPIFMQEPKQDSDDTPAILEGAAEEDEILPLLRTPSYKEAVHNNERGFFSRMPFESVRAGLQPNLRIMLAYTAQVFFSEVDKDFLQKQVDICRKIMKMYRTIVLEMALDEKTWMQLLDVLLTIAETCLKGRPPTSRERTLGGQLATYILQTLFVSWIRASLKVYLPVELWDKLLQVVSSLTLWEEVIVEWAGTMETLTRVLARTTYGIDLANPPLERLTEHKRKKLRGKAQLVTSKERERLKKSFSRGWSRYDKSNETFACDQDANSDQDAASKAKLPRSISIASEHPADEVRDKRGLLPRAGSLEIAAYGQDQIVHDRKLTLKEIAEVPTDPTMNISPITPVAEFPPLVNVETEGDDLRSQSGYPMQDFLPSCYSPLHIFERSDDARKSITSTNSEDSFASCTSYSLQDQRDGSLSVRDNSKGSLSIGSTSLPRSRASTSEPDSLSTTTQESLQEEPVSPGPTDTSPPDLIASHTSKLDPDLINFAHSLPSASRASSDTQSIDSRMFTQFDTLPYGDGLRSQGSTTESVSTLNPGDNIGSNVTLVEEVEVAAHHVRFSDDIQRFKRDTDTVSLEGQLDALENLGTAEDIHQSYLEGETNDETSVISGGDAEGWTPVSAFALWNRFLGILGNVNRIKDPRIHAKVFEQLIEIWEALNKVRLNQGISEDNFYTPPVPELIPPPLFCSTWCFEAMSLNMAVDHKPGRVLAFKLMCLMTLQRQDVPLTADHVTHFIRLLHVGLTGSDQDVINAIVSQSSGFFYLNLPSSSLLILNFIYATNTVITSQSLRFPRKEAVVLLGSLLCFPSHFADMPIHQPGIISNEQQPTTYGRELRERILLPLLKAAKNDPSCYARCVAINGLGIFIVESLIHANGHPRLTESLALIIASLSFHNRIVCGVAIDVLSYLAKYSEELHDYEHGLPTKVIEALCLTVMQLLLEAKNSNSDPQEDSFPEFLSRLLLCILDWTMASPPDNLLTNRKTAGECSTYLALVCKTLKRAHDNQSSYKNIERRRSLNINSIILGDSRPIRLARVHDDVTVMTGLEENAEGQIDDDIDFVQTTVVEKKKKLILITAKYALTQIANYLGHFPFNTGAVRPTSTIMEYDDISQGTVEELTANIFENDNVQFFMLNKSTLLSVVELPSNDVDVPSVSMQSLDRCTRLILRDMVGKYTWDTSFLFGHRPSKDRPRADTYSQLFGQNSWIMERKLSQPMGTSGFSRGLSTNAAKLPVWNENEGHSNNNLDQMLRYIGVTSPECLVFPDQNLNVPSPVPEYINTDIQSCVVTSVLKQFNEEQNCVHEIETDPRTSASRMFPPANRPLNSSFQLSRFLMHQLGYLSVEKRQDIELLKKNEQLIREIKNLDNRPCRETHKVAVFYIAPGQEDKYSILNNTAGSKLFEEFLAGMAWEVDLATHSGFMGGLERNLSTGCTAPYYATHAVEVMFHVSTRMPVTDDEKSMTTKMRHLGNDEVHIVWSEHTRDFRRGIIPTQFADVIIVIYPLENNLYRIQIFRKPEITLFGPLFDGAIVDGVILSVLVRETVINAGRAKRSLIPLFERHFEDRYGCLARMANNYVEPTSFEQFAGQVFRPRLQNDDGTTENEEVGALTRTFTMPSRASTSSDPTSMLRLLDAADGGHRLRSSSAAGSLRGKEHGQIGSLTSVTNSDQEHPDEQPKEFKRTLSWKQRMSTSS